MTSTTDPPPLRLVLPRAALDAQLALARQRSPQPAAGLAPTAGWLAHGPLVLQPGWPAWRALVAGLQPGPPTRLPPRAGRTGVRTAGALERPLPQGLALVYLAEAGEALPGASADGRAWDRWLARRAPEHRLATLALVADLAVLWLRADGLHAALFRPGDGWTRHHAPPVDAAACLTSWQSGSANPSGAWAWRPLAAVHLPGAQMLRISAPAWRAGLAPLPAERSGLSHGPDAPDAPDTPDLHGRYSRQAGALGPGLLARLQACRVAVVGAGRIGSMLVHSLVRLGVGVVVVEPDTMSAHSLDGDLAPWLEGRPKVEALQHQLRGLQRPGAALEMRRLPIASPAAGAVLAEADIVLCAVDDDAARLWANAWALALLKPLLVAATGLHPHGAEAELRLLPPGTGCLLCCVGLAQARDLPAQLALPGPVPTPADFRQQRAGSLRSWAGFTAHAAMRLLEHLADGRLGGQALMRRLAETPTGGLQVQDAMPPPQAHRTCPLCQRLQGAGAGAVQPAVLAAVAQQLAEQAAAR